MLHIPLRWRKPSLPYLFDQTPLSNCRCTSGRVERSSCRSRILAAANIRVLHAHVNNLVSEWQRAIGTRTHAVQRSSAFLEARRAIIIGRKWGNGLKVPCRYCFVAKQRLVKLEGLLQNRATARNYLLKLAFLKALTITEDLTDNTEFNKRRSQLVAALE